MLYPFCLSYSTVLFSTMFEQIFGFNYIKKCSNSYIIPKKMLTQEEILLTFNILLKAYIDRYLAVSLRVCTSVKHCVKPNFQNVCKNQTLK